MARPSSYDSKFAEQARKLCSDYAATDVQLADFFEVSVTTIYRWKNSYPEFCEALRIGKSPVDDAVERALFQRAVGYSHDEVDIRVLDGKVVQTDIIKHYPPDTKAALAWLYNRRGDSWHPNPDGNNADDMAEVLKALIEKLPN